MDATGVGTAVMLGIAAVLWFLYLVPTWLRRREYLATERTATRLQQTMRVMAETAELPAQVRVGLTAREAARQERILRAQQRRADAQALRQAAAVRRAAEAATPLPSAPHDASALRRARMRRTRALASLLMIAATIVGLVQVWLVATTGLSIGGFFVLVASVTGGGIAIATQRRLDARALPRPATAPRARTAVQVADLAYRPTTARPATWTPVETPKPLYLSRPAPPLAPRPDIDEALRAAVAASEANLRAAQKAPEVAPMPAPASPRFAPSTSRFAKMGQLDPSLTSTPDLDEVLRRRRSAG